jgi:hypothetical protein
MVLSVWKEGRKKERKGLIKEGKEKENEQSEGIS